MPYPKYFERTYVNPSGNLAASGYYVSHATQEVANKYPEWHAIRDNSGSVGHQYLSTFSQTLLSQERSMAEGLDNQFISLAHVDEIDVLYRMKIPSTISFNDNQYIECWTAPSGATPSGYPFPAPSGGNADTYNQIQVNEICDLEEFYYYTIPTRIKAYNVETYADSRATGIGVSFPVRASGITEPIQKYIERNKQQRDLTWAHDDSSTSEYFYRQDKTSLESYNSYLTGASGYPRGMTSYKDSLYWIGVDGNDYFINISNSHPTSGSAYLDQISTYDISDIREYGTTAYDGYNTSGAAWYKMGTNFTTIGAGTITYVWAYLKGPSGIDTVKLYVYDYVTSTPVNLLSSSSSISVTTEGWYMFTLTTPVSVTSGTKYGFAVSLNSGGAMQLYYETTSGESFIYNDSGPGIITEQTDRKYLFYIPDLFFTGYGPQDAPPSGIDIDEEGHIWILDEDRDKLYALDEMHDYYLVDKFNRYIYFAEDYSNPGTFVKTA